MSTKPAAPGFSEDVERLFHSEVPAVPVSSGSASAWAGTSSAPVGPSIPQAFSSPAPPPPPSEFTSTLDESIWETILRDLKRIYSNLVLVVFPFKSRDQQSAALRNWDLWGPMAFTLTLAICLSVGAPKPQSVFSLVFGLISMGAIVLTVNVVLLGGNIGFFQSMCLLGYCLFPLDIAAIVFLFVSNMLVRWIVVILALTWASWAAVPFIGGSVAPARRSLAVYPLLLLYISLGWLALIKS